MLQNSFWLVSIEDSTVSVALISCSGGRHSIMALGPQKKWNQDSEESLTVATDESLSAASLEAQILPDQEPGVAAFVLPPFWIGNDGRILVNRLKMIESICRGLKLKPTGFISDDEAVVEEANLKDGFPSSFILLHILENELNLSLVYLGKVKERLHRRIDGNFDASTVESMLLELNSDSTLPPQIIVFGNVSEDILYSLKNFPWVGKKNIETFLHFPDVKLYHQRDIINIFAKVICSQMKVAEIDNFTSTEIVETEQEAPVMESEEVLDSQDDVDEIHQYESESNLVEVSAQDLGFFVKNEETINKSLSFESAPTVPVVSVPSFQDIPSIEETLKLDGIDEVKDKIKKNWFKHLKIKNPLLLINWHKFKFTWMAALALSPALILLPFFFSKSEVVLFVTPYVFTKKIPITLDSTTNNPNYGKGIIPVEKKVFNVSVTSSVKTTGKKTVGEKAKGEIIIYNTQFKTQNIPKGAILSDSTGKKFELTSQVSVASSSSDLNSNPPVYILGYTKTIAIAQDIGPEYNISKDSKLIFKDFSENTVFAKVDNNFSGGVKRQINAVSQSDKTMLASEINESISKSIDDKINRDLKNLSGVIKETVQSKQNKVEYSREIDEEADELTASADATVSVFSLNEDNKNQAVKSFLSQENGFDQAQYEPGGINVVFKIDKTDTDKAIGTVSINGKLLPKIDTAKLRQSLVGKSQKRAGEIIKKSVARVYNFDINSNFDLIKFFNPMPFRQDNIKIDIKTENL